MKNHFYSHATSLRLSETLQNPSFDANVASSHDPGARHLVVALLLRDVSFVDALLVDALLVRLPLPLPLLLPHRPLSVQPPSVS